MRNDAGVIDVVTSSMKPNEVFDAELAAETVRRTDKLQDTSIDLAIRVKQARDFIAWSANHYMSSWFDWMEKANKGSSEMNMVRMTFERETKTIIAAAKDMQSYFNSVEYAQAQERLTQMVSMLEKFTQFKKDGTLDAFADFILKLTCK